MKRLYESAIQLINEISIMEDAIEAIGNYQGGRILLKTEECINCTYRFANVRPSAYVQFLNGELKDLKKDLKVIESEMNRKIK
jgi:hypothetical protein